MSQDMLEMLNQKEHDKVAELNEIAGKYKAAAQQQQSAAKVRLTAPGSCLTWLSPLAVLPVPYSPSGVT